MNSWRTVVILSLFLAPGALLARRILPYEPAVAECRGKLWLVDFPGPPEYESIKNGDAKLVAYILELDEPFDIASANPKKPLGDPDGWGRDVRRIQLVTERDLHRFIGARVSVKGKLSEAVWGHQRTSVVMDVVKVAGE